MSEVGGEGTPRPDLDLILPEPTLIAIATSDERVVSTGKVPDVFLTWGDHSIILGKDSNEIKIYNKDGKNTGNLGDKTIRFNWREFGETRGVAEVVDSSPLGSQIRYQDLPQPLSDMARDKIPGSISTDVSIEKKIAFADMGEDVISVDNPRALQVPGFVIVSGDNHIYVIFRTENEMGNPLEPRNWKRFEWDGVSEPPEGIEEYMDFITDTPPARDMKDLPDGRTAVATESNVKVIKIDAIGNPLQILVDNTRNAAGTLCKDPTSETTIYFCNSQNPTELVRLDREENDPDSWHTRAVAFPKNYGAVRSLSLDPTGRYFLLDTKEGFILLTKDTLEEVKKADEPDLGARFDTEGNVRVINQEGKLAIYKTDFTPTNEALVRRRLAKGFAVDDLFADKGEKAEEQPEEKKDLKHLEPYRGMIEPGFNERLSQAKTFEDISQANAALDVALQRLITVQGLTEEEALYVLKGVREKIDGTHREIAGGIATSVLDRAGEALGVENLSVAQLAELKNELSGIQNIGTLLDAATRDRLRTLSDQVNAKTTEIFRREGAKVIQDVQEIVDNALNEARRLTSLPDFEDWSEYQYPELIRRLTQLAELCPDESVEAHNAILAARSRFQEMALGYEERLRQEYTKLREQTAEGIVVAGKVIEHDIDSLASRLRLRGFTTRADAEGYLAQSGIRQAIEDEIAGIERRSPENAKELKRALNAKLSLVLYEIERGITQTLEAGRPVVYFGQESFPVWERAVKEKGEKKVKLIFMADSKSMGRVSADEVYGDAGLEITTSGGHKEVVRLFEGDDDESKWRFGNVLSRGIYNKPSYMSREEFRRMRQDYMDWQRGENSDLRRQLAEKRKAQRDHFTLRKSLNPQEYEEWRSAHLDLVKETSQFAADHHIAHLLRIDKIKAAPETEFENGRGMMQEWESHWVLDRQTETTLAEMARLAKMQLELQEGVLNLVGHAGTGKDLLVKMFCERTKRPLFAIDCSKWITEFELSEDVALEAEEGASKTVKVPSAVLNGITTPGAVMYFNEFNAMTEQAQIFLHSLFDEKRTLTLKTSSGKTVRADKSVILISSMNPSKYKGTFEPQIATRRRMVSLWVNYPPILGEHDPHDPNPNPPYDYSEALRIARSVDSLADLTYEVDLDRNVFVKAWNKEVNGINTDAPPLTRRQQFDMEVILALVQFGDKIRHDFVLQFEESREARTALPTYQPITGSEMRRCAKDLSTMTDEETMPGRTNAEAVAKDLLERYYLSHIESDGDKTKIRNAMRLWTSEKRKAAA